MRRIIVTIVAVAPLLFALPASAASIRVSAADNLTGSASRGSCQVHIPVSYDEVYAFCWSPGRTWFKVRVDGVTGEITKLQAAETGDCSGESLKAVRRDASAIVKVSNVGEFSCHYTTIVVRFGS